jgi:hypothetical protein
VSPQSGLLRKGQNILAIHGMNSSTTSSDLLFNAELVAGRSTSTIDNGTSDAIRQYAGPFAITESCLVKARVSSDNTYSPWMANAAVRRRAGGRACGS